MKIFIPIALAAMLAGCGHSRINYQPSPPANMNWDRAASIIERGFYEDYGDQKAQAVQVTDEAIILSDGSITTSSGFGSALPVYGGAAIVATNTTNKTIAAGQRIYLSSIQPSIVVERNGRDNQFAVIIRTEPGITARRVFFRSKNRAEEFADAIEYVHRAKSQ